MVSKINFYRSINFHCIFSGQKSCLILFNVQLFWECHKNLRNLSHGFDFYLVIVKTMRKIAQIFVTFSKKLNFNHEIDYLSGSRNSFSCYSLKHLYIFLFLLIFPPSRVCCLFLEISPRSYFDLNDLERPKREFQKTIMAWDNSFLP